VLTLAQLADRLDGEWHGNPDSRLTGLASLSRAASTDIACYTNPVFHKCLGETSAGAVLLTMTHLVKCPVNAIVVSDPFLAMAVAAELLLPSYISKSGISEQACIADSAIMGANLSIGAHSIISAEVYLGDDVIIGANTVIEPGVIIGRGSRIGNGVCIQHGSRIGQHVIIDAGTVIGASPFNYQKSRGNWRCGPAIGSVVIEDAVHIGANTVIDRGSIGDTYISRGVCIDNLVQIAHDVFIGPDTAIAGCAAVAAHAVIGADCIIGGASCIASSVTLANDVVISGMSTVTKNISKQGVYTSGTMVCDHKRWRRNAARFRRLDDYISRLNILERAKKNES